MVLLKLLEVEATLISRLSWSNHPGPSSREGDTGISCAGVVMQQEQRQLRIHTYRTCTITNAPPTLRELLPSRMKLARGPIVTREAMDTRLDEDEAKF